MIDDIVKTAKKIGCDFRWYADFAKDWLTMHKDGDIVYYDTNKDGDLLMALYSNSTIYLFGENYRTIMYAPKIMFHIHGNMLHIEDVLMKDNNIGNGSVAMKALLKYAKEHEITKITGYLSETDNDHKERRNHYYKKFGFKIINSNLELDVG